MRRNIMESDIRMFVPALPVSGEPSKEWIAVQRLGDTVPLGWFDRFGIWFPNPEYIEPALLPEPGQYEQALVGYELCEKVSEQ